LPAVAKSPLLRGLVRHASGLARDVPCHGCCRCARGVQRGTRRAPPRVATREPRRCRRAREPSAASSRRPGRTAARRPRRGPRPVVARSAPCRLRADDDV
jgi:hypothetical protein